MGFNEAGAFQLRKLTDQRHQSTICGSFNEAGAFQLRKLPLAMMI